jgi:hypothetical protein
MRNIFLGCKTGEILFKKFTSQRVRKRIYNEKISKVSALRNIVVGPILGKKSI